MRKEAISRLCKKKKKAGLGRAKNQTQVLGVQLHTKLYILILNIMTLMISIITKGLVGQGRP